MACTHLFYLLVLFLLLLISFGLLTAVFLLLLAAVFLSLLTAVFLSLLTAVFLSLLTALGVLAYRRTILLSAQHYLRIAFAKFAIASSCEMQFVDISRTTKRWNHISCRDYERHRSYHAVVQPACTVILLRNKFTYKQRTLFGLKAKVGKQTVIDELYSLRPVSLPIVCTSLMDQYALDDTSFLSLLSHSYKSLVRMIAVCLAEILQPVGRVSYIILSLVFIKEVDGAPSYRNIDDTDGDISR